MKPAAATCPKAKATRLPGGGGSPLPSSPLLDAVLAERKAAVLRLVETLPVRVTLARVVPAGDLRGSIPSMSSASNDTRPPRA
jgi:hypothetical protein